jgi:hypothetical protein
LLNELLIEHPCPCFLGQWVITGFSDGSISGRFKSVTADETHVTDKLPRGFFSFSSQGTGSQVHKEYYILVIRYRTHCVYARLKRKLKEIEPLRCLTSANSSLTSKNFTPFSGDPL